MPNLTAAKRAIRECYLADNLPWFVGFSGGKDSSALFAAVYSTLLSLDTAHKPVTLLFCDTGVEIPPVAQFVHETLARIDSQAARDGVPIATRVVRPRVADSFFARVIGAGYVPPTNKFRWCTDRLRVGPVRRAMQLESSERTYMLLGTRWDESPERGRTLERFRLDGDHYFQQAGNRNTTVFAPISRLSANEVWDCIQASDAPACIDAERLLKLYQAANGDDCSGLCSVCAQCAGARFGCWVCTVVRKDRASANMISAGHNDLEPLLSFRNWLSRVRDDMDYRHQTRRNGAAGPGPFTLTARQEILRRLKSTQDQVPWQLLSLEEEQVIKTLWALDESPAAT